MGILRYFLTFYTQNDEAIHWGRVGLISLPYSHLLPVSVSVEYI